MTADLVDGGDLVAITKRYRVKYVPPDLLPDDLVAIHHLTTYGRGHHVPEDDVWIDERFSRWSDIVLLHEAVENHLRRRGLYYGPSHAVALRAEREVYGGTKRYEAYVHALNTYE